MSKARCPFNNTIGTLHFRPSRCALWLGRSKVAFNFSLRRTLLPKRGMSFVVSNTEVPSKQQVEGELSKQHGRYA